MSDNMMPELTLNPTEAAQEAVPELTLTPDAPAPEQEKKEVEPVKVDESMLTEQEKLAVDEFAKKINITDTNLVLNYGVAAQKMGSSHTPLRRFKIHALTLALNAITFFRIVFSFTARA